MNTSQNISYKQFHSNEYLFKNHLSSFDFDAYFFALFCFSIFLVFIFAHTTDRQIKLIKKIHIDIWFEFTRGVCLIFVENLCNTVSAAAAVVAAVTTATATTIAAYACLPPPPPPPPLQWSERVSDLVVVYHDNTEHSYIHSTLCVCVFV